MTKKEVRWTITDQNVTVNYDGQTHIVKRSDALADRLIKAVKEQRLNEIPNLVSAAKRIETYSRGNFVVRDGLVIVNGVAAPEFLSAKIVKFSNDGLPFQPLLKFAANLQRNPSFRAVNELSQFLDKNNHPLTENGKFIAYKKVRSDFMDAYTGTFDNSVGNVVEMPRNAVNEDATQTCSHGLHVANWDYAHNIYATGTDAVMLEVEVDPADVVAVPVDYNQAKMRVCKYKVLGVVTQPHEEGVSLRQTESVPTVINNDEWCEYCGEAWCTCECQGCEFCGEPDCYGECEDEEYPYDDELVGQ
jgi:hypothetical protein